MATESKKMNTTMVQRYFTEVLSSPQLETSWKAIDELMRPDFVFRISTIPGGVRGIQAYKDFVRGLKTAFPDGAFTIEVHMAETTGAAARWNFRGTHMGPFLGVPPTGKIITDQGIDIFRFAGGKITDIWANEDAFGLLKQLGVIH